VEIPCVRFDDLSPGGSGSFGLIQPKAEFTARRLEDAVVAMHRAEEAARSGLWVAGHVAYEAAPAFNPLLPVRPPGLRDPMRELPLVRFQTFERRIELEAIESSYFPAGDYNVSGWAADSSPHEYSDDLATIGRAIMAGEVARITHTFRLHAAFDGDPIALYRDLMLSQRGQHAACVDAGRFHLVSASPTGFFRKTGDTVTATPVLASIRRGRWLEEDLHLAELLRSEGEESYTNRLVIKEIETELAELGELFPATSKRYAVERFETLWHLAAEIKVRLAGGTRLADIFAAIFPASSVTGVPKVEAMTLVTATEDSPRGVYCGAIGFLRPTSPGEFDASFNTAVRTVVIDQEEGVAEFGVGAPITTRSEAVAAYEEARLKAKVLVDRRPEFKLIEHIRCAGGVAPDARRQLATILASARYFGYQIEQERLEATLAQVVAEHTAPTVITLQVDRDGAVEASATPAPRWQEEPGADLLTAAIAEDSVSTENIYLFHHTTNPRLADALRRQHPDVDAVIYCNERGEVAGATGGSVVVRTGNEWITPPRESGNAPGVYLGRLVESGLVTVRAFDQTLLLAASEIALVDDVHGWRALGLIG
jgi:para-aminobenzoate synthetase/4-amino-4-deoxychorismate lyase